MKNIKTKNIFPEFSIETNQVFSYVNNLQELNDFTKILLDAEYDMGDLKKAKAKAEVYDFIQFGTYSEHRGQTMISWLKENGLDFNGKEFYWSNLNNNVNCDIKVDTTNVVSSINNNKDSKIVESKLNKARKYLGFGFETKIENSFNGNVGCDINIKW